MAAVIRFCGRCGAPLAPGAGFCGRCGTPVAAQAIAAPPSAPMYAGPVAYSYPVARAVAYPTPRQFKLAPVWIAGGLIVVLAVITVIVSAIAVSHFTGGTHPTCTVNCGPKIVTPFPESASYKSSAFKYQVNYSSTWTVRSQDTSGIALGTRLGLVQVFGSGASDPQHALDQVVAALPTSEWQDVTFVSKVRGAQIGEQSGVGSVYSANLVGSGSTATKVRFAVIAATLRGVTIVVFAADPADLKNYPFGLPEGREFDYLCTEIAWG